MFDVFRTSNFEPRIAPFLHVSRFMRHGVRREQYHDPGMGQAPAVREAESVQ